MNVYRPRKTAVISALWMLFAFILPTSSRVCEAWVSNAPCALTQTQGQPAKIHSHDAHSGDAHSGNARSDNAHEERRTAKLCCAPQTSETENAKREVCSSTLKFAKFASQSTNCCCEYRPAPSQIAPLSSSTHRALDVAGYHRANEFSLRDVFQSENVSWTPNHDARRRSLDHPPPSGRAPPVAWS